MNTNDFQQKANKTIEFLNEKLKTVRTGRASTALLDGVKVEAYGDKLPMNQIGTISIVDARTISVSIWDKDIVAHAVAAIQNSDLGISPSVDSTLIRLNIPQMTEERRGEIAKGIGKYEEEAKVSIRNLRHEFLNDLKKRKEEEKIPENDVKKEESDIENLVKEYNSKIEVMVKAKKDEIMTL